MTDLDYGIQADLSASERLLAAAGVTVTLVDVATGPEGFPIVLGDLTLRGMDWPNAVALVFHDAEGSSGSLLLSAHRPRRRGRAQADDWLRLTDRLFVAVGDVLSHQYRDRLTTLGDPTS